MPPSLVAKISSGCAQCSRRRRNDDVEQAGANDKAKDHTDHDARQVVDRNVRNPSGAACDT